MAFFLVQTMESCIVHTSNLHERMSVWKGTNYYIRISKATSLVRYPHGYPPTKVAINGRGMNLSTLSTKLSSDIYTDLLTIYPHYYDGLCTSRCRL